jgi:branched-chain amino acid transport system ATP-binding protein
MTGVALEVVDLEKRYGALRAVAGVSLRLGHGELIAVVGPNGAGKTTLLSVVAGEQPATAGTVRLAGRDVSRAGSVRRAQLGVGRTFQVGRAFRTLSVRDNVALARAVCRRRRWRVANDFVRDTRAALDAGALLDRLGLAPRAGVLAADLTQGDLKRLDLAMALALEPTVLLLDEPTAGVGTEEAQSIGRLIRSIWQERTDLGIVLISHDMRIVFGIAPRIVVMHEGAVILEGTPEEIQRSQQVRALYLGESL